MKIEILEAVRLEKLDEKQLEKYIADLRTYMLEEMPAEEMPAYRDALKAAGSAKDKLKEKSLAPEKGSDAPKADKVPEKGGDAPKADKAPEKGSGTPKTDASPEKRDAGPSEGKDSDEDGWGTSYIDTTYDTTIEERPKSRGFVWLLLAAVVTSFVLAFTVPAWWMIYRGNLEFALPQLPEAVTALSLPGWLLGAAEYVLSCPQPEWIWVYVHLGCMVLGLIFTFIAMGTRSAVLALIPTALFIGASVKIPPFFVLTGFPAFCCFIAFLRKLLRPARER